MPGPFRTVPGRIVWLALRVMPTSQRDWAQAMMHEVEAVEPGPGAVLFALGCVKVALIAAVRDKASRIIHALIPAPSSRHSGKPDMNPHPVRRARDPIIGILCAICAVSLGVIYMVMGGAPQRLILINLGAVVLGLGLCLWLVQSRMVQDGRINVIAPVLGLALLGTAFFGLRAEGAARWVDMAGLVIQPTLLLIPLMVMLHARKADALTATGLALVITATAAQPDRAMAGVLFCGLAVVAAKTRTLREILLAVAAATGFGVTLIRPDNGGISPFVDQILFTSFDVHLFAGLGLVLGVVLLVVPGLIQATRRLDPSMGLVFSAMWSAIVVAALMGNYPTPLVGYGGSAIIGYLLSIAVLGPVAFDVPGRTKSSSSQGIENDPGDPRLMIDQRV